MDLRYSFSVLIFLFISANLVNASSKEDITFSSGDIELAGTLFIPKGSGPFPAVVFVHGSGPETRKNSSYSAKWFASIGYIALTYDKRGTGKSGGNEADYNRFSFDDLSDDVVAAVQLLKSRTDIDAAKIGIHATSQGGWVATAALAKTDDVSFMIVRSASVCTVGEDRIFERAARLKSEGFTQEEILEAKEMQLVEGKVPGTSSDEDPFQKLFMQYKSKRWFSRVYPEEDPNSEGLVSYREWYSTIIDFDPLPYLRKSSVAAFWIFGDHTMDSKGPIKLSVSNLEQLFKNGKDYAIVQYEGESHNINERKYEQDLYEWLCEQNNYHSYKFKKH